MALCDEDRIGKVIEFAEANLDLAGIATGAADELGMGRGFEQHSCLDCALQELRRFPGWDGRLYDCDFNQMLGLQLAPGLPQHIRDFDFTQLKHRPIVIGQHCYGCTAGCGSGCQGAVLP